jgi:hypothetical protein
VRVGGSDLVLRVTAPAAARLQVGEAVGLRIAVAACIPLASGEERP